MPDMHKATAGLQNTLARQACHRQSRLRSLLTHPTALQLLNTSLESDPAINPCPYHQPRPPRTKISAHMPRIRTPIANLWTTSLAWAPASPASCTHRLSPRPHSPHSKLPPPRSRPRTRSPPRLPLRRPATRPAPSSQPAPRSTRCPGRPPLHRPCARPGRTQAARSRPTSPALNRRPQAHPPRRRGRHPAPARQPRVRRRRNPPPRIPRAHRRIRHRRRHRKPPRRGHHQGHIGRPRPCSPDRQPPLEAPHPSRHHRAQGPRRRPE